MRRRSPDLSISCPHHLHQQVCWQRGREEGHSGERTRLPAGRLAARERMGQEKYEPDVFIERREQHVGGRGKGSLGTHGHSQPNKRSTNHEHGVKVTIKLTHSEASVNLPWLQVKTNKQTKKPPTHCSIR